MIVATISRARVSKGTAQISPALLAGLLTPLATIRQYPSTCHRPRLSRPGVRRA